ncbi:flagellar biosynthesis anti-sigma factor FlgM [Ferrimonas marina]|uniref:Negative regulator of flagellin synthesis n=1 Tax=Ferrimonas marina TaxID=299255 RepID=A0A1M5QZY1_9GAMM|nr:flagellar biosynthesis anti-sigma factor FlgM [Ferrimonas marina]SHH19737.1 anti-sigma-28 factor, FlgM family [Ferrimonas marina]
MEINKLSSNFPVDLKSASQPASAKPAPASQKPANKEAISEDWQLLDQANRELAEMADVDLEKVNALRTQLKNGTFDLDLSDLAGSMMEQHG